MGEKSESLSTLWLKLKQLAQLKYDYAKLTFAEKLTMILAMLALGLVCIFGVAIMLFFLSVALAEWMAASIGMAWACTIIAGIYLIVLVIVVCLRKYLFIDPISRFITKLLL